MSKTASIGKRPTTRPSPAVVAEVAEKAAPPKMKRLTIDIPDSLHRRVKSRCGHEGLRMADVIRDLLEQRFPKDLSF